MTCCTEQTTPPPEAPLCSCGDAPCELSRISKRTGQPLYCSTCRSCRRQRSRNREAQRKAAKATEPRSVPLARHAKILAQTETSLAQAESDRGALEEQLAEAEAKIEALRSEVDQVKEEHGEDITMMEGLTHTRDNLLIEIETLKGLQRDLYARAEADRARVESAEARHRVAAADLDGCQRELADARAEIEESANELDLLRDGTALLNKERSERVILIARLQEQVATSRARARDMEASIAHLEASNDTLASSLKAAEDTTERISAELEKAESDFQEDRKYVVQKMNTHVNHAEAQRDGAKLAVETLKERLSTVKAEHKGLRERYDQLHDQSVGVMGMSKKLWAWAMVSTCVAAVTLAGLLAYLILAP